MGGAKKKENEDSEQVAPLRYAAPLGGPKGALLRSLPVLFVLSLVLVVVGVYVAYHIAPLLQQHGADRQAFGRGLSEFIVFLFLFAVFILCFALSVFVRPGTPNETDEDAMETHTAAVSPLAGLRCMYSLVLLQLNSQLLPTVKAQLQILLICAHLLTGLLPFYLSFKLCICFCLSFCFFL